MAVGAGVSKAADRYVDQPRIEAAQGFNTNPHAIGRSGSLVLHEHIRAGDHAVERGQRGFVFKIKDHRTLAAIDGGEGRGEPGRSAHVSDEIA